MIFSIFRFFCTLRFQIYKYCPNLHQWKYYLFSFQMMHTSQFSKKLTLMTGFVLHRVTYIYISMNCIMHVFCICSGLNWIRTQRLSTFPSVWRETCEGSSIWSRSAASSSRALSGKAWPDALVLHIWRCPLSLRVCVCVCVWLLSQAEHSLRWDPGGDARRGGRPQTGAGGVCGQRRWDAGRDVPGGESSLCARYQGLSCDVQ